MDILLIIDHNGGSLEIMFTIPLSNFYQIIDFFLLCNKTNIRHFLSRLLFEIHRFLKKISGNFWALVYSGSKILP